MNTCPKCGSDKLDTFRHYSSHKEEIKEEYCRYCGYHHKITKPAEYAPL